MQSVGSQVRLLFAQFGFCNALLYALHRTVQKFSPSAAIERLNIVSLPIPAQPLANGRRGGQIEVRRLAAGDPAIATFKRLPGDIAARFQQGAVCLGAFRNGELLAWLWYVLHEFSDSYYPLDFDLTAVAPAAWDFDVYVRPEARLTAAFSRLWDATLSELRDAGVEQTLSAISAFNAASLRSHRRLGARQVGSLLLIRFGRFQAAVTWRLAPRLQFSNRPGFRGCIRIPASVLASISRSSMIEVDDSQSL